MTTNEIEKELRMLDEVLAPLYLEVEAGFAEDLHVKLAKFILAYGEKEYKRGREDHIQEENCNCQCSACNDCASTQP